MTLYGHVGVIAPGLSLDRQAALTAVARSRGLTASVDDELRAVRQRIQEFDESVPACEDARRRVAETEASLERERERIATLRGRLQECDDEAIEAEYRSAVRKLTEVETEYTAAREALEDARQRARVARDRRDRRLRLEDRLGNLEREARAELCAVVEPAVDTAVSEVPGSDTSRFREAAPITAALALVRAGEIRRPVVLACRRFPDAVSAERWLGAPVVRL